MNSNFKDEVLKCMEVESPHDVRLQQHQDSSKPGSRKGSIDNIFRKLK